jgi:hypothetical protein
MIPPRVQRKRALGFRLPADAVNVCRPTIWGNPFIAPDPADAVAAYRRLILPQGATQSFEIGPGKLSFAANAHPRTLHWNFPAYVAENIHKLRGRRLACYCALDAPCHADVLLEIANK